MSRFYSVGIADAVSNNAHVDVRHTFFGLSTTARYTETGSRIDSQVFFYDKIEGSEMLRLLELPDERLSRLNCQGLIIRDQVSGCFRLEVCLSRDHRFLALQLSRYIHYIYVPLMEVRYFEGDMAENLQRILN